MRLSRTRAALLTAAMNVVTIEPLDLLRYLRVPAIHYVLRRQKEPRRGRICNDATHRPRRRRV